MRGNTMMNNLATRAFIKQRKIKKSDAMDIISSLYDDTYCDSHRDQLVELYSYFKPSAPKKAKTPQEWVCKAVSENNLRVWAQRIQVTGGKMAAYGENRLYLCDTTMVDGAYDTEMNLLDSEVAGRFPDWKRIIPEHRESVPLSEVSVSEIHTAIEVKYNETVSGCWVDLLFGSTNIRFEKRIWDETTQIFTGEASVFYDRACDSVKIEQGGLLAVIMPVLKY